MECSQHFVCVLLLFCPLVLSSHNNYAFNTDEAFQSSSAPIVRMTRHVSFSISHNQPPIFAHRIKKLTVTAGKTLRFVIPSELFTDPEEGSNLTFAMYEAGNILLSPESWIQFIPRTRIIYGLPLPSQVSRWNFIVEAKDSEGLVARGPLDITVQHHRNGRNVNHQFIMKFKLLKQFKNIIDWQIRTLEGILNLFGDKDIDHLTVLNVTKNGEVYEFAWANDTLPKYPTCPIDDINRLMKIMESNTEPGRPSSSLTNVMSPDLEVLEIRWRGTGRCMFEPMSTTSASVNFPPLNRNSINHLTGTAGHLFVYKVPEDTFFDVEDGGTRNLKLSLKFGDESEVPSNHWLQFDARNQEFYGLPTPRDEGSANYLLIAEDSGKKSAHDSFVVEVARAPAICPTAEFQITIYPSVNLMYSANYKRKIIEKLAVLFGQNETDNIRIQSIIDNPTTIVWSNTSSFAKLTINVEELHKNIVVEEEETHNVLKEDVDQISNKTLKITSIRLIPRESCANGNAVQLGTN